jgi:hypothetical protein
MNFGQLQQRAANIAQLEGWTDTAVAPDWPTLVNQAWRDFSVDVEVFRKTDTSLSTTNGTAQYTVPGKWAKIEAIASNGVPLLASTVEAERFRNPGWFSETGSSASPPKKFVTTGFGTFIIVPAPFVTSQLIVVFGVLEAPDMVLNADEPGTVSGTTTFSVPSKHHEAIAERAAWLQGLAFNIGPGTNRMMQFEATYKARVAEAQMALNMPYRRGSSAAPAPQAPQGQGQ